MSYMKAGDTISGKEGTLTANIGGKLKVVAECKNINAKVTKTKAQFNALGHRGAQYKATGWEGSGTFVVHYISSTWVRMIYDYIKKGIDTYFTLTIKNSDPTSNAGTQTIMLMDCNLDEVEIAKLDVDSEFLDQSVNFTFSDVNILSNFNDNLFR